MSRPTNDSQAEGRPVDHGRSASFDINYGLRQNTLMPPVRLGPPPRHPPPCWGPWLNAQHNTHSLPQRGRPMTQPSPPQISHTVSSANDFQRGSTSVPVARPPPVPAKELLPSRAAPLTESKGPGLFSVFEDRQNSQHQQMHAAAQSIAAANSMEEGLEAEAAEREQLLERRAQLKNGICSARKELKALAEQRRQVRRKSEHTDGLQEKLQFRKAENDLKRQKVESIKAKLKIFNAKKDMIRAVIHDS